MRLGKVVGTVVATQKDPKLVGWKLLLVRELKMDGTPTDTYVAAVDTVGGRGGGEGGLLSEGKMGGAQPSPCGGAIDPGGAGVGETVLTVAGSSARLAN